MASDSQKYSDGRYYAKGDVVHKSPMRHPKQPDGVTPYTLGFPVCTASGYVSAEAIAEVLNNGDDEVRATLALASGEAK